MKLLNNVAGYEELRRCYPLFYQDVYEMKEILKSEGGLLDGIRGGIETIFSNQFIDTADEATIADYERIMKIPIDTSKSLNERRTLVKSMLSGNGKLSSTQLKALIRNYTNADSEITFTKQYPSDSHDTLMIRSCRGDTEAFSAADINDMLEVKIPAHINFHIDFDYESEMMIETLIDIYQNTLPQCGQYSCGDRMFL